MDIAVEIRDLECLKAACQRLGWTLLNRAHKWNHFWVDDSPVPRGIFATEEQYQACLALEKSQRQTFMTDLLNSTEYAIQVPGTQWEIGVLKVGERWALTFDWVLDGRQAGNDIANRLAQPYALEAVLAQIRKQGQAYLIHDCGYADCDIEVRVLVNE